MVLSIVGSFMLSSKTFAKNDTFKEFAEVSDRKNTSDEAKEIAHYSDYILPIITTQNWCLGSRAGYNLMSGENKNDQKKKEEHSFHVNRCTYLHASDYARLNHILALNANLKSPDNDHLIYLNHDSKVRNIKGAKLKDDNDMTYLINFGGKGVQKNKILPTAKTSRVNGKELAQLFIPGVDLLKDNDIFGLGNAEADKYEGFKGMFYGSLNVALRDCTETTDDSIDPTKDKSTNDRAILLNPDVEKIKEITGNTADKREECLQKCKNLFSGEDPSSPTSIQACYENKIGEMLPELSEDLGLDPDGSYTLNIIRNVFSPILMASDSNYGYKNCLTNKDNVKTESECLAQIMNAENNTILEDLTNSIRIQTGNEDESWLDIRTEWLVHQFVSYYNSCNRQFGGYSSEDECKNGCETKFPEIKGYDRPNCSTLASILLQTDHPIDAQYFITHSSSASKWLPLTETEKIVMEYGKNLDHNRGGNEVVFFEDEPASSCYFRGVKSLLCTFSNFLGALTDSAFNIIESFVRFPAKILRSQSGAGEINLYTAWKTFRDIANVVLIIIILVSVFSQITGWRVSSLGVRNNLPRFLVAAVLVNLSFFFCQIAIDVSNIVGAGINGLFSNGKRVLFEALSLPSGQDSTIVSIVTGALSFVVVGGLIITAAFLIITNLVILLPVLLSALVTATMTLLALLARQIFIVILILVSPIVFALSGTQATSKYTKRWWQMLFGVLVVYPLVSLAFGVGDFAYSIISAINHVNKGSFFIDIAALALLFLPLTLVPKIMKESITKLPLVGDRLSRLSDRSARRTRGAIERTGLVSGARANKAMMKRGDLAGRSRPNPLAHPLRALKSRLNRPKSRSYRAIYNRLYSTQLHMGAGDDAWMKDRTGDMYKYGNGDMTMERVRSYNRGGSFDAEAVISDLLTVSDDGAGYFEEVMLAVNKISKTGGVDTGNLSAAMEKVIEGYAKNSRYEVVALLKEVRNATGGRYDMNLEDFNTNYSDSQLERIVQRELLSQSGSPRALRSLVKFAGADKQTKVDATLNRCYPTNTTPKDTLSQLNDARSSQIGVDSFYDLYSSNDHFHKYMVDNYHSMGKKGQDFIQEMERIRTSRGGTPTP
jgi:hypothetical protein